MRGRKILRLLRPQPKFIWFYLLQECKNQIIDWKIEKIDRIKIMCVVFVNYGMMIGLKVIQGFIMENLRAYENLARFDELRLNCF